MLSICLSGEIIILETGVNSSLEEGGGIGRTCSGAAGADSIWGLIEASVPEVYDFIPASIQFQYDPEDLATKITTQMVHQSNSKTYV